MKKKDPEYYKKQLFSNNVNNYIVTSQKIYIIWQSLFKYLDPRNLDNKVYIRKKNANYIRFSDAICHMNIQFYQYKKY